VKNLPLLPDRLPFWLDLIKWIWFATLAHEALDRMNRIVTRWNTMAESNAVDRVNPVKHAAINCRHAQPK
jgi:hypothetical protein